MYVVKAIVPQKVPTIQGRLDSMIYLLKVVCKTDLNTPGKENFCFTESVFLLLNFYS